MKIEINLDIEAILREEIRKYIQENIIINNVVGDYVAEPTTMNEPVQELPRPVDAMEWEYAPKLGKRRSKAQQALHKQEVALGRLLTPEEKGEAQAVIEIDDAKELKAKEDAKNQARIKEITDTVSAEAAAELEAEAAVTKDEVVGTTVVENLIPFTADLVPAGDTDYAEAKGRGEPDTPTIPKTEELPSINSLFS